MIRVWRPLVLGLTVAAALTACELPSAPEPENPYDPLHTGIRTPNAASDLTLASSTSTSVTLTWADNSGFESGYRIECLTGPLDGPTPHPTYEVVGEVGPNVTTFTDEPLLTDAPRRYRIVALAGAGEGEASNEILVAYPYELLDGSPGSPRATSVAFSPDGEFIAVSEEGGPLRLFDAATLAPARVLPGGAVFAFSPDGAYVAVGGDGVRVYRLGDGALVSMLLLPVTHPNTNLSTSVSFSPDGMRLAAVGSTYGVRVWDWMAGEVEYEFSGLEDNLSYRQILYQSGGQVLTERYGEGITVWDIASGTPLRRFGASSRSHVDLALHPDGRRLAVATTSEVALWDVETGERLRRIFRGDPDAGDDRYAGFGVGGTLVAVADAYEAGVYDLSNGTRLRALTPLRPQSASFDVAGAALIVPTAAPS